jgi:WD40 repeat protein
VALDERLRRELDRAAQPADPSGIYEHLIRRRERRQIGRKVQTGVLAVAVVVGSIAGVYGLSQVFEPGEGNPGVDPSPVPIAPHDNGRIAFSVSTDEGVELRSVLPGGSDEQVIPTPPGLPWLHAWSPDGTRIAVSIFPNGDGDRAIWVMNADGSDPVQVAAAENVSVPSWSPDGTTIAYSAKVDGQTEIHLVSADGTNDRIVHAEGAEGTFAVFSAKFSPDGTKILFDRGTESGFDILVMRVDGTDVRPLTSTGTDYDPHWSPDGTQIAFTREEVVEVDGQSIRTSDIFVMYADGTDVRRLTDGGAVATNLYAEWSPDATKIAYIADVTGGPGSLIVMNADGSDPTVLVDGEVLGISWQPLSAEEKPVEPSPTPSAPPRDVSEDIGLGFPVCFSERLGGIDYLGDGTNGAAWTAVPAKDDGTCPRYPDPQRFIVAADHTGDRVADSWVEFDYGCYNGCPPWDATDLDANGTEELIVATYFSIMDYHFFAVRPGPSGDLQLEPILVADPGHEPARIFAGEALRIDAGGDAGYGSSIECEGYPAAPVIVWSWIDGPVEGNQPLEVHVTRIELQADGLFHVIDTNDSMVPAGTPFGIPYQSELGRPACGVVWYR